MKINKDLLSNKMFPEHYKQQLLSSLPSTSAHYLNNNYYFYKSYSSAIAFMLKCLIVFLILHQFASINHQNGIIPGVHSMETFSKLSEETWGKLMLPNYVNWTEQLFASTNNLSTACYQKLRFVYEEMVHERKPWASKMFNSWSHSLPNGFFMGTLTSYGDYDQCMSVDMPAEQSSTVKYCLVDWEWPVPKPRARDHNLHHKIETFDETVTPANQTVDHHFSEVAALFYYTFLRVGTCVPKECSQTDIQTLMAKNFEQMGFTFSKMLCTVKPTADQAGWKPNYGQIAALVFLVPLLVITIIGTLYDLFINKSQQRQTKLLWFSIIENTKKLLLTESSNNEIGCVHGIRIFTIIWIIIGHTLDWASFNMYRDTFAFKDRLSSIFLQPIFKGFYSVDTFFYLSGMLTSYMTIQYTKGHYKNFNSAVFIIFRYLRLMPQLMVFLMIFVLMPPLFDGPVWTPSSEIKMERCSKSWWQQLFFIQNFDVEHLCSFQTWYLAADMQLHWISLIPVIYLLKNPRSGLLIAKSLILIGVTITAITIYVTQLAPGGVVTYRSDFLGEEGIMKPFFKMTQKPWSNMDVFFIGFLFGYYLTKINLSKVSQTKATRFMLWMLTIAGYLICIYYSAPWLYGRPYVPILSAILYPMSRIVWAITLTLFIWLCSTSAESVFSKLMSNSLFRPLARMTYSVYLCHSLVLQVALETRRDLIDVRVTSMVYLITAIIVLSYMVAFVFTVVVEAPTISFYAWLKHVFTNPSHPAASVGSKYNGAHHKDKNMLTSVIIVQHENDEDNQDAQQNLNL